MSLSEADRAALRDLEESLWRSETRFDRARMEATFADDFFEIGRSGRIHTREACLALESQPIDIVLPLPDFEIRVLADGVVQITYTSLVTYDGRLERGRRSSIWSRASGRWRLRFHQGTPFADGEEADSRAPSAPA